MHLEFLTFPARGCCRKLAKHEEYRVIFQEMTKGTGKLSNVFSSLFPSYPFIISLGSINDEKGGV
jgi:hypothetical protein